MGGVMSHLKGNKHGCKQYPRDTSWGGARANAGIKSLAKKQAAKENISLADYIEKLILIDLKNNM